MTNCNCAQLSALTACVSTMGSNSRLLDTISHRIDRVGDPRLAALIRMEVQVPNPWSGLQNAESRLSEVSGLPSARQELSGRRKGGSLDSLRCHVLTAAARTATG